jgi:sigma-B regulation protein RsbU (phosphoserine phosphatase)
MSDHAVLARLLPLADFHGDAPAAFRRLREHLVARCPGAGCALLHTRLPGGGVRLAGWIDARGIERIAGSDDDPRARHLPRYADALAQTIASANDALLLDVHAHDGGTLADALDRPAALAVLPVAAPNGTGFCVVLALPPAAAIDIATLGLEARVAFALLGGGFLEQVAAERQRRIEGLADIQRLLQPADPSVRGIDYAVHWQPAETAAGDYYDLMNLSHLFPDYVDGGADCWGMMVGDVSGHGAAAAMEAVQFDAILRTYRGDEPPGGPAGALTYANRHFFSRRQRPHFMTVFGIGVRADQRGARYVNGGHLPAILRRGDALHWLGAGDDAGIPLGVLREHRWDNAETAVLPGDVLVAYTDGITEARDRTGAMFGAERLATLVADGDADPAAIVARVRDALFEHQGGEVGADDQTLIVVRQVR